MLPDRAGTSTAQRRAATIIEGRHSVAAASSRILKQDEVVADHTEALTYQCYSCRIWGEGGGGREDWAEWSCQEPLILSSNPHHDAWFVCTILRLLGLDAPSCKYSNYGNDRMMLPRLL